MPQLRELTASRLDLNALAAAVERRRETLGLSLRQVASQLGIAPSTLTRVRQGKRPDAEALAVLVCWSGLDLHRLLAPDDPAQQNPRPVNIDDDHSRTVRRAAGSRAREAKARE